MPRTAMTNKKTAKVMRHKGTGRTMTKKKKHNPKNYSRKHYA